MYRTLFALPVLLLGACAASDNLASIDASRSLSDKAETQIVCTEPVVTEAVDGTIASSISCEAL